MTNNNDKVSPGPELWLALRKAGFVRSYRSEAGGGKIIAYTKRIDPRRSLTCQIWYDGCYRISSDFNGCSDTAPTEFTTLSGMSQAIDFESTRTDSKWALPGTLPTEQRS